MLNIPGLLSLLNDKGYKQPDKIKSWKDLYFGMSLHIDGACPMYTALRDSRLGWVPGNFINKTPLLGWYGPEYHQIFDLFLFSRHPKEPEITRQWRFSQYKPFTKQGFGKAISMITGSIFQDSGYSITLDDQDDNDYIWGNNFQGKKLTQFVSFHFKSIAEDPNGFFLVIPKEPGYVTTTSRVEPDVWFIYTKEIHYISKDEIIFKRDGIVWVINKVGYFRFAQRDQTEEYYHIDEAQGGYYAHMLGYIPMFVAGGKWNTQGHFDSWLVDAKAIADEYVSIKSAEQMVNKEASHPWIIEASEDCPDCNHIGQVMTCYTCRKSGDDCQCESEVRQLHQVSCSRCGGSGQISHNPGDRLIAPKEDMKNVLVQVVNAPVDINKLHKENVAEAEAGILKALHLYIIDQAQSGRAKEMDMMTRNQFVMSISNDLFDRLITKLCETITALRNIGNTGEGIAPAPKPPVIVKPTQFLIKTAYDLLEEMEMAKKANVPAYIYGALWVDYTDKQFGGDEVLKRKTMLINQIDKLANKTDAEISVIVLAGGAEQRDYQFHVELPIMYDQLVNEWGSERIITSTLETLRDELLRRFKLIKPILPVIDPTVTERVDA